MIGHHAAGQRQFHLTELDSQLLLAQKSPVSRFEKVLKRGETGSLSL
jgi:hypothetical protein